MTMTDPIADMLTRLRNAIRVGTQHAASVAKARDALIVKHVRINTCSLWCDISTHAHETAR